MSFGLIYSLTRSHVNEARRSKKNIWSLQKTLSMLQSKQIKTLDWNEQQYKQILDTLEIASDALWLLDRVNAVDSTDAKQVTIESLRSARDFAKSIGFDVPKQLKRIELTFGVNEAPRMKCEAYPDFSKLT